LIDKYLIIITVFDVTLYKYITKYLRNKKSKLFGWIFFTIDGKLYRTKVSTLQLQSRSVSSQLGIQK